MHKSSESDADQESLKYIDVRGVGANCPWLWIVDGVLCDNGSGQVDCPVYTYLR